MADAEEGDAAFLAETTDDGVLLLESHLLHTETEALLSFISAPSAPSTSVQEPDASSCSASPAVATKSPITAREASEERSRSDKAERRRAVRNAQATLRRAKHRQQLKAEWQSLWTQESELSEELSRLQKARAEVKALRESSLMLPAWRAIATLQRERRREAEAQHEQLKAAVAAQSMVIQQMNSALQQTLAIAAPERFISREKYPIGLESAEIALFEAFLRELEPLYAQTDEVTHPHGLKIEPTMFMTYKPICKRQKDTVYYESVDAMRLPFDFQRAVVDVENTVAVKYPTKHRLASGESTLMVTYCVMRMYRETERLVFVWQGLTEGQGEFAGMHSNEMDWLVVRPSTVQERKSSGAPIALENCMRYVPMHFGGASGHNVAVNDFPGIIEKMGESELAQVTQMLARLLVDEGGAIPAEMAR